MQKLFSIHRKEKIWNFDGGIYPPEMKNQSSNAPLRQIPLARYLIIPLKLFDGTEDEPCVNPGDHVLRGQLLTLGDSWMTPPVHAPTSGKVKAITLHTSTYSSTLKGLSVIIETDGEDRWIERDGWSDYFAYSCWLLIERIHQFGVVGLGGTGFPTGAKLHKNYNKVETLIINAVECEPYVTADDRLVLDYAAQIIDGIHILAHILQPREILIGIEDNKPQAISSLRSMLVESHNTNLHLRIIPTKYPSGSSNLLIQILTGKQVPYGCQPSDIGVLVHNVGTVFAVKRAVINGEPLTERIVTLTGGSISKPSNFWVRLGTPVRHVLELANFFPSSDLIVIMGGPLLGFTIHLLDVPVLKTTNCLLAPSNREVVKSREERDCIRCGACADVCPARLLPLQLYWYSRSCLHNKVLMYNLTDCIECGACAWVCPSNIPLVQYFRLEKAEIYAISMEEKRASEAKARFEARLVRLKQYKYQTQQDTVLQSSTSKREQDNIATVKQRKATVEAAIARVQARKNKR